MNGEVEGAGVAGQESLAPAFAEYAAALAPQLLGGNTAELALLLRTHTDTLQRWEAQQQRKGRKGE